MATNYRTMIEHHKENLAGAGDFNSFAEITKDDQRHSGWAEKVVIHYVVEDRVNVGSQDSGNLLSGLGFGAMFVASRSSAKETVDGEAGLLDTKDIMHIRCRSGTAGSVTLPIRGRIVQNGDDTTEKDGKITLWVKYPDITVNDQILIRFYLELHGRWVEIAGV